MFSTEGLSHGEIVVTSGIFAIAITVLASVIGVAVAYLTTLEWKAAPTTAEAPAEAPASEARPTTIPTAA